LPCWGRIDAWGNLALELAELDRYREAKSVLKRARSDGLDSAWLDSISAQLRLD